MAKALKTVDSFPQFLAETKKLKMPGHANVFQINQDIRAVFDDAMNKNTALQLELHYDEATKTLVEIKSRMGKNVQTQWP
jgi:hypothetical protein